MKGHIVVIDSGIGGLSVLTQIRSRLPEVSYSYAMDNQYLPYGELPYTTLIERLQWMIKQVLVHESPDLFVIACNTASTQALDVLRTQVAQPIVGVVPAIKPAAKLSTHQEILLLATPATVDGVYVQSLIDQFAVGCHVHRVGSAGLVHLAEKKLQSQISMNEQVYDELKQDLPHLKKVDVVILGCTHFPFLLEELQFTFGESVQIVDSGEAIARRVEALLQIQTNGKTREQSLYVSKALTVDMKTQLNHTYGFEEVSLL
ncbi:glutamate racemase [Algicola sagamiensis]|uniref:glutamate racemase n=1 Tax=Algicola sagamiensis TaxID=163869 RepID=UPI0003794B12|nr:glutamate racemase [Algicola sagamiensis]